MNWTSILVLAAGCASAERDTVGRPDAGNIQHPDASTVPPPDAYVAPDAPPGQQTVTLSQTTSQTLQAVHSIACQAASPDFGTTANNYYRVFDLASLGITTDFHVTTISFQVEDCESLAGNGTVVAVRTGTYSGTPGSTLAVASMTVLASNATVQVPEIDEDYTNMTTPGGTVNAAIAATIPAGQKLFIELDAPDGTDNYQLYVGTNNGGQVAGGKGYVSAPACMPPGTTPTDASTLGAGEMDYLFTVSGTY